MPGHGPTPHRTTGIAGRPEGVFHKQWTAEQSAKFAVWKRSLAVVGFQILGEAALIIVVGNSIASLVRIQQGAERSVSADEC